jgi:hypothetical protein
MNDLGSPSPRIADWHAIGSKGHAVQFYTQDDHLLDLLTRYVGTALVGGDVAVVAATPVHHNLLLKRLKARGFDVSIARQEGRFLPLDAAATLSAFMRDGRPDESRFMQLAEQLVTRATEAAGPHARIVAFGEMVSLLWAEGRPEAAIRLEELWNQFAQNHVFSLCCAYPMHVFDDRHAAQFLKVCAQHSFVFPASAATQS